MYPILRYDVLLIKSAPDPCTGSVSYYVINHSGDRYRVTPALYSALLHADGTHPLFPEEDDKALLLKLEQFELILTSRVVPINFFLKQFILFPVGSTARPLRPFCSVLNFFLPWAAVCVFVLSRVRAQNGSYDIAGLDQASNVHQQLRFMAGSLGHKSSSDAVFYASDELFFSSVSF